MNCHQESRRKIWRAMRIFRRFTFADIARVTGLNPVYCGEYIRGLKRTGHVRDDGTNENRRKVFRLIKDEGPAAPEGIYTKEMSEKRTRDKPRPPKGMAEDIRELYQNRPTRGQVKAVAEKYGCSVSTIQYQAKRLGIVLQKQNWSNKELSILRKNIDLPGWKIAEKLAAAGFQRTASSANHQRCAIIGPKFRRNKQ